MARSMTRKIRVPSRSMSDQWKIGVRSGATPAIARSACWWRAMDIRQRTSSFRIHPDLLHHRSPAPSARRAEAAGAASRRGLTLEVDSRVRSRASFCQDLKPETQCVGLSSGTKLEDRPTDTVLDRSNPLVGSASKKADGSVPPLTDEAEPRKWERYDTESRHREECGSCILSVEDTRQRSQCGSNDA